MAKRKNTLTRSQFEDYYFSEVVPRIDRQTPMQRGTWRPNGERRYDAWHREVYAGLRDGSLAEEARGSADSLGWAYEKPWFNAYDEKMQELVERGIERDSDGNAFAHWIGTPPSKSDYELAQLALKTSENPSSIAKRMMNPRNY